MSAINARCGVSLQSIAKGDVCRVVLISQASSYQPMTLEDGDKTHSVLGIANTTVYPNCFWRPDSGFFKVVYDDYGMSELVLETHIDRSQVATYFADLWSSALRTQKGENPYHDLAFDFPAFVEEHAPGLYALFKPRQWLSPPVVLTDKSLDAQLQTCWTHLCNMVRRHRVFVRGYNRHVRPLAMFVAHEHAYQGLVEYMQAQKDWDGNSYELNAYLERAIAKAHAKRKEWLEESRQKGEDEKKAAGNAEYAFLDTLRSARNAYDVDSIASNDLTRYVFDHLVEDLRDGRLSEQEFIRKGASLMHERAAICAMNAFDITFQPMTYVGADFKNTVGQAYTRFIAAISEKVTADRRRLNDE